MKQFWIGVTVGIIGRRLLLRGWHFYDAHNRTGRPWEEP